MTKNLLSVVFTLSVFEQQVPDAPASVRIDTSSRFIQDHNLWAPNKSQGYWELPLHTTCKDNKKKKSENCFQNLYQYGLLKYMYNINLKNNQTDRTVCWCVTVVCEAVRHHSQFAPSRPSPSPQAVPSDGHRTRCVPPLSAWIKGNQQIDNKGSESFSKQDPIIMLMLSYKYNTSDTSTVLFHDSDPSYCIRTCWTVHCAGDRHPDFAVWCWVQCGCPCRGCRLYQRWVGTIL